jgi:hypothetical protein
MDVHGTGAEFALKSADGALGSHIEAVRACYQDFQCLATRIAERIGISRDA